jgi:archaellum biogenesis protein FlaJ (TadC family)
MASKTLKISNMLSNMHNSVGELSSGDVNASLEEAMVSNAAFVDKMVDKLVSNDRFLQLLSDRIAQQVDSGELVSEVFTKEQYVGDDSIAEFLD